MIIMIIKEKEIKMVREEDDREMIYIYPHVLRNFMCCKLKNLLIYHILKISTLLYFLTKTIRKGSNKMPRRSGERTKSARQQIASPLF
jgi:hypothetical protein